MESAKQRLKKHLKEKVRMRLRKRLNLPEPKEKLSKTKETKQSKRDEITEAKEGFLETMGLKDIHYGDPLFFEDIALLGIKPIRLLADAIDNLQAENNYEGLPLLLKEVQKKLDDLIGCCERWDQEERAAKDKIVPRPIRQELLRLEGYLESVPAELQAAKEGFERLKPLLAGLEKEEAKGSQEAQES